MPIVELGDVCEFLDHQRKPVSEELRKPGPYPYYGANGQQGWVDGYIFDEPLVLLAEDGGHFGSRTSPIAYKISGKTWVNNHAHVLRPLPRCDIDYLAHALSFYDVSKLVTGSTRPKLTKGNAETIRIPLPSLSEQRRTAGQFEKADRLRRTRRYALELSDTFLKSAFLEMFGDPIRNTRGWDREKFSDLGTLDRGKSKHRPRNAPHLYGGKYPFVQTGDVANCANYIKQHHQTYSEEGLKQSRLWPAGTLCITIAANIAKTGILTYPACFPDSVVGFLPNENVTTEFVQYWLSFLQVILERTAPESAQKNINLEILRELPVPLPPLRLQQEFGDLVRRFEELRTKGREAERQAEHLFQTLLHRAFASQR